MSFTVAVGSTVIGVDVMRSLTSMGMAGRPGRPLPAAGGVRRGPVVIASGVAIISSMPPPSANPSPAG